MKLDSPIINVLIKTCLKACKPLIRDFGEIENLQVSSKGPGDFVSSSDKKTEEIIILLFTLFLPFFIRFRYESYFCESRS